MTNFELKFKIYPSSSNNEEFLTIKEKDDDYNFVVLNYFNQDICIKKEAIKILYKAFIAE